MRVLTVTTDFGSGEGYAGAMAGALLRVAPDARICVISNDVPSHDILHGAFVVATAAPHFPSGTVHLAVVDPGVGGSRKGIVLEAGGQLFVGPDNGLFTDALERDPQRRAFEIDPARVGLTCIDPTFHGRDVFAPVAAGLARGSLAPADVGPRLAEPTRWALPEPREEAERGVRAAVLHVDSFGNVITTLRRDAWGSRIEGAGDRLHLGGAPLPLVRTYADAEGDGVVALWGSSGRLELARREQRADEALGISRGVEFLLEL